MNKYAYLDERICKYLERRGVVCSHCQEWVVTPEKSRHNKRLLVAAREAGK